MASSAGDSLIRITTWNVAGGQPPASPTMNYIFDEQDKKLGNLLPDIQAVGFQEVSQSIIELANPWEQSLTDSLGKRGYVLAKSHYLGGIFLYIYVLRELIYKVRDFETESVRTGFAGVGSNKGGVTLRFNFKGNSICITNSHLAAHQEQLAKRLEDYKTILDGTVFLADQNSTSILKHEYAFWFGDLNFRLDNVTKDDVLSIIRNSRLSGSDQETEKLVSELYKNDQLTTARRNSQVFQGFTESLPKFLPTYKFKVGSRNDYDANKRIPAWTDRILFRNLSAPYDNENGKFKLDVQQLAYNSLIETSTSDHKPVFSVFKIATHQMKDVDRHGLPLNIIKFLSIPSWKQGEDGHFWYKISNEIFNHPTKLLSSGDKIALFKSNFTSLSEEQYYVYPNNIARVAPRLNAPTVAYQKTPPGSRSSSPSRDSPTSQQQAAPMLATEAITLNDRLPRSTNESTTSSPTTPRAGSGQPIVEDGFKYFHHVFPDESLIPGQTYVLMYLKHNPAIYSYNVIGMSEPFDVKY